MARPPPDPPVERRPGRWERAEAQRREEEAADLFGDVEAPAEEEYPVQGKVSQGVPADETKRAFNLRLAKFLKYESVGAMREDMPWLGKDLEFKWPRR